MEINESALKQVAALLGSDVETVSTFLTSGEGFTLPELHTTEQLNTFGANKDKEGYERGKSAFGEIYTKDLKKKYPEVEYEGKQPDEMIKRIINVELTKAQVEPNTQIETLKKEKEELSGKLQQRDVDWQTKESEYQSQIYSIGINNKLLGMFPKESVLPNDKLLILFNSEYKIKNEDGEQVVYKGEEKIKDTYGKATPLKDVVNTWVDDNKFITHQGFGGDDKTGKKGDKKFTDPKEHYDYCIKNNIEPMGEEGQALLEVK